MWVGFCPICHSRVEDGEKEPRVVFGYGYEKGEKGSFVFYTFAHASDKPDKKKPPLFWSEDLRTALIPAVHHSAPQLCSGLSINLRVWRSNNRTTMSSESSKREHTVRMPAPSNRWVAILRGFGPCMIER
jgi:hypothetical protein